MLSLAPRRVQDPELRKLMSRVLAEYRRTGPAYLNENLKHVLRMVHIVRGRDQELRAIGCSADILEAAILVSDMAKEPHFIEQYAPKYGGDPFRAFLDHSRISMVEGNRIRREIGFSDEKWREILRSVIGHDGPSIPGSWWKENYERAVGKEYPSVVSIEGLIHCYLDRMDQGGLFRGRNAQLNGGLRKISYDVYVKGITQGDFPASVREVFENTRQGTLLQIKYLDEVLAPQFLGKQALPRFLQSHRREFDLTDRYYESVDATQGHVVKVRLDRRTVIETHTLGQFWRALSQVDLDEGAGIAGAFGT